MKLIDEEIKILKDLKNHFILKYFDSFVVTVPPASKILYLVTEYFSHIFTNNLSSLKIKINHKSHCSRPSITMIISKDDQFL